MKSYTNNNRPSDTNPLEYGDTVSFALKGEAYRYSVSVGHLYISGGDNALIFKLLEVDKKVLAYEAYRYTPLGGLSKNQWPETKGDDFLGLTRLVNMLYDIIESPMEHKTHTGPIKELLRYGDTVKFEINDIVLTYTVDKSYLQNKDGSIGYGNRVIFNQLGLSPKETNEWANLAYGYRPDDGVWPPAKHFDYKALTNFVNEIYLAIQYLKHAPEYGSVWEYIKEVRLKTPELKINNSSINQITLQNGNTIKVATITPTIVRGEERKGRTVCGKISGTSTKCGHLSHGKIFGGL